MCKSTIAILLSFVACVAAKPHLLGAPLAYTAPAAAAIVAPAPYVTSTSSQVIARNYNGIATAPIVAPVAPFTAAYTASPFVARYATPFTYASGRLIASPYTALSPLNYASPYAAPLQYAAAAPYVL